MLKTFFYNKFIQFMYFMSSESIDLHCYMHKKQVPCLLNVYQCFQHDNPNRCFKFFFLVDCPPSEFIFEACILVTPSAVSCGIAHLYSLFHSAIDLPQKNMKLLLWNCLSAMASTIHKSMHGEDSPWSEVNLHIQLKSKVTASYGIWLRF